ncbi:MAG: carboxypeptidase regulatory-like domain-containing protein [Ruminococcaceae bacterium]|nr:carboxypeptidase regulatory-like domain-containing protein [Oscillospiraceae bacterium]
MERPSNIPDREQIDRYSQELMALYRQREPAPMPEQPSPVAVPTPSPAPPEETPENAPYIGFLQVFAFTGAGAQPIEGARVIVSRPLDGGEQLYANTQTDRSGLTPVIPLPSVDPAMTLQPSPDKTPYVAYDIQVSALGYTPVVYENVPVYGGNGVTQPAALTPLAIGDTGDIRKFYRSGGPDNL